LANKVARTPARTADFHFVESRWQAVPYQRQVQHDQCLGADGKVAVQGEDTEMLTLSFGQQLDGTLGGVETITVLTNECGFQGWWCGPRL
jgi:serine/threonine-protein kinase